jgi:hypothetical protein
MTMKKLFLLLALGLIGLNACRQSSPGEIAPEALAEKLPTSKVVLSYTGEIKDGDWIEIDGFRMLHLLDTSNAVKLPGEPVRFWSRENTPMFSPIISPEALWPTQPYFKSWMTGRWVGGNKVLGYPPISLAFYMDRTLELANPYGQLNGDRPYKLVFEGVPASEWAPIQADPILIRRNYWDADLNRFTKLIIERTDGQPIRIRTSEGYAAKVEYQ